jgi:hypothetical protein
MKKFNECLKENTNVSRVPKYMTIKISEIAKKNVAVIINARSMIDIRLNTIAISVADRSARLILGLRLFNVIVIVLLVVCLFEVFIILEQPPDCCKILLLLMANFVFDCCCDILLLRLLMLNILDL